MWQSERCALELLSVATYTGIHRARMDENVTVGDKDITLGDAIAAIIYQPGYKSRIQALLEIVKTPEVDEWVAELRIDKPPARGYGFLKDWPGAWGVASGSKKKNHARADISTFLTTLEDDVFANLLPRIKSWVRESPPHGVAGADNTHSNKHATTGGATSISNGKRPMPRNQDDSVPADSSTRSATSVWWSSDVQAGEQSRAARKRRVHPVSVGSSSGEVAAIPADLQLVVHQQQMVASFTPTIDRIERSSLPSHVQDANEQLSQDVGRTRELYLPEDVARARDMHERLEHLDGPAVRSISEGSKLNDRKKSEQLAKLTVERMQLLDDLKLLRQKKRAQLGAPMLQMQYVEETFEGDDDGSEEVVDKSSESDDRLSQSSLANFIENSDDDSQQDANRPFDRS